MLLDLLLASSLILVLVKSSDYLVEAVARLAHYLNVKEFIIGITIIAIGTSLPELASSIMASMHGVGGIVIGNVIGANIINISLNLALSAIFVFIHVNRRTLFRDVLFLLMITALFFFLSIDGIITLLEGALLLSLSFVYILYLFHVRPRFLYAHRIVEYLGRLYGGKPTTPPAPLHLPNTKKQEIYRDFVGKGFDLETYRRIRSRISPLRQGFGQDVVIALLSLLGIYLSSKFLISVVIKIATELNISYDVIGASLIALGTSLPEVAVSFSSIRKGHISILLGNIIGSNIFNITLIVGLSSLITPLLISPLFVSFSLPLLLVVTAFLPLLALSGRRLQRIEGVLLLILYIFFIYTIFIFGTV